MASRGPRSSQTTDIRSMVIAMITMGNRATESPVSMPSLWKTMLMSSIRSTTTMSTAVSRGTSNRRRRSSRKRMESPRETSSVNRRMPPISCVSRKASAISTGMNVPKVSTPTKLRMNTITSAPTGIISSTA